MPSFQSSDAIREHFSAALSDMYRREVPLYGSLLDIVAAVNRDALAAQPDVADVERDRLESERHGAIRLGTAAELFTMRRIFVVMGMQPVGYYDLSSAGVPVHATAFRPAHPAALARNPFRVFTSLLRLDLIDDAATRTTAASILRTRRIFSDEAIALADRYDRAGGLTHAEAERFVGEVLETFRWHGKARVDYATYRHLHDTHRLIADVVSFPGPHINHLTPRTLDIDAAQAAMRDAGIPAKSVIEGPPRRAVPILLRQTSFRALEEAVTFGDDTSAQAGTHTARFGEIEQRGAALTRKGRALYDTLLARAHEAGENYDAQLSAAFADFPDDIETLRRNALIHCRYAATEAGLRAARAGMRAPDGVDALIAAGWLAAEPITYEDFLPVSAAGIFQSNLGAGTGRRLAATDALEAFEHDLGASVGDPFALYAAEENGSLTAAIAALHRTADGRASAA